MFDQKLAGLVDRTPHPAALLTAEGILIRMNEAYKKLFGISLPALVEGKYNLARDEVFLKNLKSPDDLFAALRGEAVLTAPVHYAPAQADPAFGFGKKEPLVLETSVFPVPAGADQPGRAIVVHRNVTDVHKRQVQLAESEKRYRTLTEALPDMLFCVAPDQTVLFVNSFSARQFRTTPEQITGKKLSEFFPQPIFERMWRNIERVFESGKPLYTENKTYFGETMRWLDTWLVPLCDTRGTVYSIMGVSRDITEKIKYKEELESTRNLESLGILAGGIAHDFNNILSAILGSLSLLKLSILPSADDREIVAQAEQAALRAKDLTDRLLTFSKGGAPVRERASISDLVRDSTEFVVHGTAVRQEIDIAPGLWACEFDAGQISQTVQNIVMNAVQAMPRGGVVKVSVSNEVLGENHPSGLGGRFIRIAVRDQGAGITDENLAKVFVPFFTTRSESKGLGLSIAYSIVKKHGGALSVESKPGAGTTVTILLPALDSALETGAAGAAPAKKDKTGRRVLVIDDEAFVRFTMEKSLLHLGCRPALASGGEEGYNLYLRAFREGTPYDAVIIDLTIPGGAGGSVIIADLLKTDPKVKAIVMSGYPNSPVLIDPASFGFKAVIRKPFSIADLEKALDSVL